MLGRLGGALALLLLVFAAARASEVPRDAVVPAIAADATGPGSLLRAADRAIAAGAFAEAETLLRSLAGQHPVVADYADLERLRLFGRTDRPAEALALAEAWPHTESPLRGAVHREVADARVARGDEAAARVAYEAALAATEASDERAAILFALGASFRRSGQAEEAARRWLEVWVDHPLAELPELEPEIEKLEGVLGRRLRTADRTRERADVLFTARYNERALAAYERAIELGLSGSAGRRAKRQRAHTLFRMRRYPEATEAFAALPRTGENRTAQARARARSGDVFGAAEELEVIAREVGGSQGAYAKLVAALLWDGEGRTDRARPLFASLARSGGSRSRSALWWLGWDAYRAGRYDVAQQHFGKLAKRERSFDRQLRARYWHARAGERQGRASATEDFAALARDYPLSYYGWRAGQRVPDRPEEGEVAAAPAELTRGASNFAARQLARPRILLEAGRVDAARDELGGLYARAKTLADRLLLADLYANAGDFHRAQRIIAGRYASALARAPEAESIELWWHSWPAPFPDSVDAATKAREGLEPALVYAIMREESGYRPKVRSVAGAFGLMQLMPDTATRVAERDAVDRFEVDDLFEPAMNIRLGAAYLHELLRTFEGRASAAIGSYNAGPHRIERWLADGPSDDDEWVEAIPYEQTRTYVKKVLRSVHAYKVLY